MSKTPEDKVPPLHPKPARGLKSKFTPVNASDTVPEPIAAEAAAPQVRRPKPGARKSGGTGPKQ